MTIRRLLRTRAAWFGSVVVAGFAAAFALWDPLAAYERTQVSRTTQQSMESLRADLQHDMQSRLSDQIRVAELWGDDIAPSRRERQRERELSCRLFLDDHVGYLLLEWVDPVYRVVYAVRRGGWDDGDASDFSAVPMLRAAAERSRSEKDDANALVTPRFEIAHGRDALAVVVPVVRRNVIAGFLVALLDVKTAFDEMVEDHKDLGYSLAVSDAVSEIYRMPGSRDDDGATFAHEGRVQLPGATWIVRVWPKPQSVAALESRLPQGALVLGGMLGSVLMLAVHFGVAADRTSRELQRAHDETEQRVVNRTLELGQVHNALQGEAAERKRAQDAYRDLSGKLLRLQDEERRRIARDLHDSTAQMLGALAIDVDRARALTQAGRFDRLEEVVGESGRFIEQVAQEIRNVCYLLHPPMLEELGLAHVLTGYAEEFSRRSGIEATLDIPSDLGRLPGEIELTFFRIAQEALVNVQRHSGSSTVAIRLSQSDGCAILEVRDQGRGLPQPVLAAVSGSVPAIAPMGVGIAGMHERVRHLRGEMRVTSGASGTAIRAVLPLVTAAAPGSSFGAAGARRS